MGLFSAFKRKRRTGQTSFTSYKSTRLSSRKPFVPKVTHIQNDRASRRRSEKTGRFLSYIKIFLGLVALLGLIYWLFFTAAFEIQNIEVEGEADTSQEQTAIKETLQEYLGDNLLLFDVSTQETELLKSYAYLKTLDIDRDFFHTIHVRLETFPPVANVRMEFENGTSQYFVINERGFIASIGTNLENLPLIVMDVTGTDMDIPMPEETVETVETVVEETTETPTTETPVVVEAPTETTEVPEEETEPDTMPDQINEELIPQEMLTTLLETATNFEGKFGMEVLEIYYLKRARELHLYTERYFFVWIDLTQDVSIQLAKLKKALTEIDIYAASLEYIDLRISGQNGTNIQNPSPHRSRGIFFAFRTRTFGSGGNRAFRSAPRASRRRQSLRTGRNSNHRRRFRRTKHDRSQRKGFPGACQLRQQIQTGGRRPTQTHHHAQRQLCVQTNLSY